LKHSTADLDLALADAHRECRILTASSFGKQNSVAVEANPPNATHHFQDNGLVLLENYDIHFITRPPRRRPSGWFHAINRNQASKNTRLLKRFDHDVKVIATWTACDYSFIRLHIDIMLLA
jgi:hypothetical protein